MSTGQDPSRAEPFLLPRVPRSCFWEITQACNARCVHCGSDAGQARKGELNTERALALVAELAELGCQSVTFSGGEPLLRSDWTQLARAVRAAGMQLEMITNGLAVAEQADTIAGCGFAAVTFSIDGPEEVHDALRGVAGGLAQTLRGARALRERSLAELWNDAKGFAYNRAFAPADLGPGCRDCSFATLCRGGCQSLCWATTGAFHHNAHCILAARRKDASG